MTLESERKIVVNLQTGQFKLVYTQRDNLWELDEKQILTLNGSVITKMVKRFFLEGTEQEFSCIEWNNSRHYVVTYRLVDNLYQKKSIHRISIADVESLIRKTLIERFNFY